MLRTLNAQPTLWEALLPEMCLGMPAELEVVDRLLDDQLFFEPFVAHFHAVLGRPSVPIETYLRLMFLKYRYRLGFEPRCREVADSISWQRFCRIPLGTAVPHPTTLMKITTRCGAAAVEGLNEALLAKAAAAKVLKTNRVRADTTVVPADVAYPTDSGLLAKGVAKMAKAVERLKDTGLAPRVKAPDRTPDRTSAGHELLCPHPRRHPRRRLLYQGARSPARPAPRSRSTTGASRAPSGPRHDRACAGQLRQQRSARDRSLKLVTKSRDRRTKKI